MVLANQPTYPHARAYVLKLHRTAAPAEGRLSGLLESVTTGKRSAFANLDELIAILARDAFDAGTDLHSADKS